MWLYIHIFSSEELLGSIDRQILDLVDPFLACIVSLTWISLAIFVGKNRSIGLEDGLRDIVLTRNELEFIPLAILFSDKIVVCFWVLIEDMWCCLLHSKKDYIPFKMEKIEVSFYF